MVPMMSSCSLEADLLLPPGGFPKGSVQGAGEAEEPEVREKEQKGEKKTNKTDLQGRQ